MGEKVLLVEKPIISNITRDNFIFTVLNNNKCVLNTFVLHNYIDVFSSYDERSHDFYLRYNDHINCFVQKKYFEYTFIQRHITELYKDNLTNIIKHLIDLDYYVLINIDCFYLKAYNKKNHNSHEVMIYGYYDELQIFYIKDFFDGKFYTSNVCTFDELALAFNSFNNLNLALYSDGILALKVNPLPDFSVDFIDIKTKIHDYINAKFYENVKINYGISLFDIIEYQLKDERNHGAPMLFLINKVNFVRDNIFLMKMRIDYFNQFIDLAEEQNVLKNLVANMESLSNVCYNMLMNNERFNIHENSKFLIKIKVIYINYQVAIRSFLNKINDKILNNRSIDSSNK